MSVDASTREICLRCTRFVVLSKLVPLRYGSDIVCISTKNRMAVNGRFTGQLTLLPSAGREMSSYGYGVKA